MALAGPPASIDAAIERKDVDPDEGSGMVHRLNVK